MKKLLIVGDSHGQFIHWPDAEKLLKFRDEWKPHITLHIGDAFDFTALRKGACDSDRAVSLSDDMVSGKDFLRRLRPDALLLGNHEDRLFTLMESPNATLAESARYMWNDIQRELKNLRCQWIPYDASGGVYKVGQYSIVHGYHAGIQAVRKHAQIYGHVIVGHIHQIAHVQVERSDHAEGWSFGCMCDFKNMDYMRHRTGKLRWQRGWGYGLLNEKTGDVQLWQAQKTGGKWYLPTEVRAI